MKNGREEIKAPTHTEKGRYLFRTRQEYAARDPSAANLTANACFNNYAESFTTKRIPPSETRNAVENNGGIPVAGDGNSGG